MMDNYKLYKKYKKKYKSIKGGEPTVLEASKAAAIRRERKKLLDLDIDNRKMKAKIPHSIMLDRPPLTTRDYMSLLNKSKPVISQNFRMVNNDRPVSKLPERHMNISQPDLSQNTEIMNTSDLETFNYLSEILNKNSKQSISLKFCTYIDTNIDEIYDNICNETVSNWNNCKKLEESNIDEDKINDLRDILKIIITPRDWNNILTELKEFLELYNDDSILKDTYHPGVKYNKQDIINWLGGKTAILCKIYIIYENGVEDGATSQRFHVDDQCRFTYNLEYPDDNHLQTGFTEYLNDEIHSEMHGTSIVNAKTYLHNKLIGTELTEVNNDWNRFHKENGNIVEAEANKWKLHKPDLYTKDGRYIPGTWHRKNSIRRYDTGVKIKPRIFAKIDFNIGYSNLSHISDSKFELKHPNYFVSKK